jgi:polyvinyl alcohol dehydrogenase (cytochrome)
LIILAFAVSTSLPETGSAAVVSDVQTYLGDMSRSGYYAQETLTPSAARRLQPWWSDKAPSSIPSQPLVSDGRVYWGSWDGFMHATDLKGTRLWSADLGRVSAPGCIAQPLGPSGTPAAATVNGSRLLFAGGGSPDVFALDAATGRIRWQSPVGSAPADVIWGSPALDHGSVFVGVAGLLECKRGRGRLVKLSAADGRRQGVFEVVPSGCKGGGLWGSPTIDQSNGVVYVGTGDVNSCDQPRSYGFSVLALRTSDLSLVDSWQVPAADRVVDSDFGSTPTLFTAARDGTRTEMLGIGNKNGSFYAFDRAALRRGPLWRVQLGEGGPSPFLSEGVLAPAAWDGNHLLVAGGKTKLAGAACTGSLRALDPAKGAILWETCVGGPIVGAVIATPSLAIVEARSSILVADSATGEVVLNYTTSDDNALFVGGAVISGGVIFAGTFNRLLLATKFSGRLLTLAEPKL